MSAIEYTSCQQKAIETIIAAWHGGVKLFGLYGAGGVGKTFTASVIIERLLELVSEKRDYICEKDLGDFYDSYGMTPFKKEALILAPTNSAVKSIKKAFSDFSGTVTFKTIHSALGLAPDYDDFGEMIFSENNGNVWDYPVIFVDEASMVSKELTQKLLLKAKQSGAFLIASGDRPQLPPVNETSSSLMDSMDQTFEMTTIVRQKADNPITPIIKEAREAVELVIDKYDPRNTFWEDSYNEKKEGYYVYYDDEKGLRQITRAYIKAYQENDFEFVKMLAFTNAQCKKLNDLIRARIWGDFAEHEYIKNDLVICKKPVEKYHVDPRTGNMITKVMMTNGTECLVTKVQPTVKEYIERSPIDNSESLVSYKGWNLTVEPIDYSTEAIEITVIDSLDRPKWNAKHESLRQFCISFKEQTDRNVWYLYYRHLTLFNDFSHAYCITVHASQGKTYKVIGVDIANIINFAKEIKFRNQLVYTAVSRAKTHLILI